MPVLHTVYLNRFRTSIFLERGRNLIVLVSTHVGDHFLRYRRHGVQGFSLTLATSPTAITFADSVPFWRFCFNKDHVASEYSLLHNSPRAVFMKHQTEIFQCYHRETRITYARVDPHTLHMAIPHLQTNE